LRRGPRVPSLPARSGEQCNLSRSAPSLGSGAEPGEIRIFEHFGTSKITSERSVRLGSFLVQRPTLVSQYVVNEGTDNKLNSMDSVLVRAGFSWWGAWGPAIGVGDRGQGVALPHYTPKIPENIFSGKQCKIRAFSGQMSCKIRAFC